MPIQTTRSLLEICHEWEEWRRLNRLPIIDHPHFKDALGELHVRGIVDASGAVVVNLRDMPSCVELNAFAISHPITVSLVRDSYIYKPKYTEESLGVAGRLRPMSSTRNQVLATYRTQLGRKDKRVANPSKPAKPLSKKTANLNGHKTRLVEELRRTLDPKSLYSPNSNILILARDIKRSFKRVNNK